MRHPNFCYCGECRAVMTRYSRYLKIHSYGMSLAVLTFLLMRRLNRIYASRIVVITRLSIMRLRYA